jgi:uncharacterized membrane protein
MPRSIELAVCAEKADAIIQCLDEIEGVVGLARQRNASIAPPGDVLTIQTTNDGSRAVFATLEKLGVHQEGTILTSDLTCLISPAHQDEIGSESSETIWDEMAFLLRLDTNIDFNYLALMFLAGAIAAGGLWADKVHLVIGAMVIAPAFEPLIRVPFGLVSGMRLLAMRGVKSSLIGYAMLIVGAGIATLVLQWIDPKPDAVLENQVWVSYWSSFTPTGVFISLLGAAAGAVVVCGLRSVLTTGVMITLALIPGMSLVGMGIATADFQLAGKGFSRWAVDAALVLMLSAIVLGLKQTFVHRRRHWANPPRPRVRPRPRFGNEEFRRGYSP